MTRDTDGSPATPRLDRLRDERDHLLVSLDDLDEERSAGDIDPADYRSLRDGYVARAADLSRAIDGSVMVAEGTTAPTPLWRRIGWVLVVVLIAAAAAYAMTAFSGARSSGETASGEIRLSSAALLAEAASAFSQGDPDRSIELYGEVLGLQPTNVEALTYRGWVRYQLGETDAAATDFDEAVAFDPTYPDVRVFRTVLALDRGDVAQAASELDAFDAGNPTPIARQLVDQRGLRERVATGLVLEARADGGQLDLTGGIIGLDQAQLAGETFVRLSQPADALTTFDAILRVSPDDAAALAWRGWTLALTGESGAEELFVDAERWLAEAVAADPEYPDARVFRSFLFRRLDRRDEARAELLVFDGLADQPPDMLALIEQFDLRELLGE